MTPGPCLAFLADAIFPLMGTLRFALAAIVVLNHAGCVFDYCGAYGWVAVKLFYVVSGFLIALVLNTKYEAGQNWLFYSNRALRIYVPYLFVLAVSLMLVPVCVGLFGQLPYYFRGIAATAPALDAGGWMFAIITNLVILGQDAAYFLGFDGHLYWSTHFTQSPTLVLNLDILPQAWSISLELMFYAIAPFILRRNIMILGVVTLIFAAIRYRADQLGITAGDPWAFRFFPFELHLFLFGALSYRLYALVPKGTLERRFPLCLGISAAAVGSAPLYQAVPLIGAHIWVYFVCMAAAMPFLFVVNKRFTSDRTLGDLSYPIYLIHWPAFSIVALAMPTSSPTVTGIVTLAATVALSYLFVRYIDEPLDAARQRRVAVADSGLESRAVEPKTA